MANDTEKLGDKFYQIIKEHGKGGKAYQVDLLLQACKEAGYFDKALICQSVCRFRMEGEGVIYCGKTRCPLGFYPQIKEIE